MANKSIEIVPLANDFGAKVLNAQLEKISDEEFQLIHDSLLKYKFLVIKNQENLTASAQREFSLRFGVLQVHPEKPAHLPEFEDVNVVSNMLDENGEHIGLYGKNAEVYHSDVSWGEFANKITFLRAKIVPSVGGETYYANTSAAYDDLSEEWKARLKGLKGHFTYLKYRPWVPALEEESKEFSDLSQGTIHPLISTHRLTKAKVIFANEGHTDYVVGVSKEESDEILNFLFQHIDNPKYRYIHYWEKGDAVLWDNRALQHRATEPPPEDRYLVRTTIIDEYQAVEDLE